MAYLFVTSSKDSTIYFRTPEQNTGLDEILEITKTFSNNRNIVSRCIVQFRNSDIEYAYNIYGTPPEFVNLKLKQTQSRELPIDYTVYGYPVSGSWEMGDGYRANDVTKTGVTWFDRNKDIERWIEGEVTSSGISYHNLYPEVHPSGSGGVWYTEPYVSQDFSYSSADIDMEISNIVETWLTGSIENNGIIFKFSDEVESDRGNYGTLKFYSKETHTIYQPKLVMGWDTQAYETGSLQLGDVSKKLMVFIKDLKPTYRVDNISRFRLTVKDKYPLKTFENPFPYTEQKRLPETSYYQIRDFASKDVIIPFSEYSKINCDSDGNYIDIDFLNWESGRVYNIEFKVVSNGSATYFDSKNTFNLVKN